MSEVTANAGEVVEPKREPRPDLWTIATYDPEFGRWFVNETYDFKEQAEEDVLPGDVSCIIRIPAEGTPSQADALRACVAAMKAVKQAFGDDDDPDGVVAQVLADHRDAIAQAEAALGVGT